MRHGAGLSDRRTVTAMRNPRADDHEDQAPACILGEHENCPHLNGYGSMLNLRRLRFEPGTLLCKCDCHSSCPLTGKRAFVREQTWHESCTCPAPKMSAPGEIRPESRTDSQPLLDSQSASSHIVTVPLPCQNGERIRGSHGYTRTSVTRRDLGDSRSGNGRERSPKQ